MNRNPAIYLHIPKTGGTYVGQLEAGRRPVIYPIFFGGHCIITDKAGNHPKFDNSIIGYDRAPIIDKEIARRSSLVISTVRNPFSWLVSYFHHARGTEARYRNVAHYDYKNAKKGFDFLLKTIINRENKIWPNKKLIHFPLFADDSTLIVDYITRNELLDTDLKKLAQVYAFSYLKGEKQRVQKYKDYRSYYSDGRRDLVYMTYGRELALFGYGFEGIEKADAFLVGDIKERHEEISYDWFADKLLIHGVEANNYDDIIRLSEEEVVADLQREIE